MDESSTASGATPGHIPKRGARACTACRKGKNRCEGEVSNLSVRAVPRPAHRARWPVTTAPARVNNVQAPCRRCQLSGQPCVFEKPEKKNGQLLSTASVELVSPRLPLSPLSYSALSSDVCLALKASTL